MEDSMLDQLSPQTRHLVILILGSAISALAVAGMVLSHLPWGWALGAGAVIGPVLASLTLLWSTLTAQYGRQAAGDDTTHLAPAAPLGTSVDDVNVADAPPDLPR
jgi:hypothetical protein